MRRIIFTLIFLVCSKLVICQLTEIKSIDTIQVTGRILFIDSLCDMTKHYSHWGNLIPYYLVLIEPDTSKPVKFKLDHRLVIRIKDIKTLSCNKTLTFKIIRTEFIKPNIPMQDNGLNTNLAADSILNQIDKSVFVFSFMEKIPCFDYSLKEKLYLKYEIVE